jgi:hypothetical protein
MSMVEAIGLSETLVASYKKTRLYKTLKLHIDSHENLKFSCDQTTRPSTVVDYIGEVGAAQPV